METDDRIWMATSVQDRDALARVPHALVGRRIVAVRYVEIGGGPWWRADGFHALDYGVEIDVDDPPETWSAIWKAAGGVEALLVYPGPLVGHELVADGEYGRWDASAEQPWASLLGEPIVRAEFTHWESYERASAPVAARLRSDHGEVVLVLGAADDEGRFVSSATDVAVFTSTGHARQWGAIADEPGPFDALD